jgi:hypothetical protein
LVSVTNRVSVSWLNGTNTKARKLPSCTIHIQGGSNMTGTICV